MYRKGSLSIVPDVLSRCPDYQLSVTTVSAPVVGDNIKTLCQEAITKDEYFKYIFERASKTTNIDGLFEFQAKNDLLYLKKGDRLCIPDLPIVMTQLSSEITTAPLRVTMVLTKHVPAYPNITTGHACTAPSSIISNPVIPARPLKQEPQKKMGYYSRSQLQRNPGPI